MSKLFPKLVTVNHVILNSGKQLISLGIRFFGSEQGVQHSPATLGKASIKPEQVESMINSGRPAYEILQEMYPQIDLKGVSEDRMNSANIYGGVKSIADSYGEELAPFMANNLVIDPKGAEAFFTFLMTKGVKGSEILRDLEHYASANLCIHSSSLDDVGPNFIDPAIHVQIKQMRESLKNPDFLKAQKNQPFVPNVFALQYGAMHTGIRTACQRQGLTCIEINATPYPASRHSEMHQEEKSYYLGNQAVIENIRRFKSSKTYKTGSAPQNGSPGSERGWTPLF